MSSNFLNLDHVFYKDIGGTDFSSSLPIQTIPFSRKNKKWKRHMMDRLEEIAIAQVYDNIKFRDYKKMYEGRLVYQDFEDAASTTQAIAEFRMEEVNMPTYIKHFDIIGIIVNQLSGEFAKQKDLIRVASIDDFSQGEFLREKNTQLRQYTEEYFKLELKKGLVMQGFNPEKQDFNSDEERQQYAQLLEQKQNEMISPMEIEDRLSKTFKTTIAEWAEHTLEADSLRFDLEDKDMEELVDYLLTGRYFTHFHIGHDFYKPEKWEVETTFFSKDLGITYPQDGEYAGRVAFLSGSDVLQRYGDKLPKKTQEQLYGYQIQATSQEGVTFKESLEKHHFGETHIVPYKSYYQRDLAHKFQSVLDQPGGLEYQRDENGELEARPAWLQDRQRHNHIDDRFATYLRDDIRVRTDLLQVTEAYWRSAKLVGLLTIANPITEIPYQIEVTEDLLKEYLSEMNIKSISQKTLKEVKEYYVNGDYEKIINTIAWFYVPQVWKGKKINGGNSVLVDDVVFDVEPMPFQIRGDSNLFDVKLPLAGIITSGIAQKIRPYQVKHNLAMNLIENSLEKHMGSFLMFDMNFLPSQYKNEIGETTAELIEEWRQNIRDVGFGIYDSSPGNTNGQNPNASVAQQMRISFVEDVQYYMQLAQFYKNEAFAQIGINNTRLGTPTKYETAEGVKQGATASYAQTDRIYKRFNTAKRKEREIHLRVAQYCVKNNKDITVDYLRPDGVRILKKFQDPDFHLRKMNVIPINDSEERRDYEEFKNIVLQNNTLGTDLLDQAKLFTSKNFLTLVDHAQKNRERLQKETQEQRLHEQQLADKQIQAENLRLDEDRKFKASESKLERKADIKQAEILAISKIADNNGDKSYIDEIEKASDEALKLQQHGDKMNIQQQEVDRKRSLDESNVKLQMSKLEQEAEKIKFNRDKMNNDRFIALVNKN